MHVRSLGDAVLIFESPFQCNYPIYLEVVAACSEEPFPKDIFVKLYALSLEDIFGYDGAGTARIAEASLLEEYPLSEKCFII